MPRPTKNSKNTPVVQTGGKAQTKTRQVPDKRPNPRDFPFLTDNDGAANISAVSRMDILLNWGPIVAGALQTLRSCHIDVELLFCREHQISKEPGFYIAFEFNREMAVLPLHEDLLHGELPVVLSTTLQSIAELEVAMRREREKVELRQRAINSLQDWQREALGL